MPKLFEVRLEYTYYALAETEDEAEGYAGDAFSDALYMGVTTSASEIPAYFKGGYEWDDNELVYGAHGEDITLAQAKKIAGIG